MREWETRRLPAPKRRQKWPKKRGRWFKRRPRHGVRGGVGGGGRAEKWWKIVSNESVSEQKHSGGTVRSRGSQYSPHPSADWLPAV